MQRIIVPALVLLLVGCGDMVADRGPIAAEPAQAPSEPLLPNDPAIRTGTLDNGLRYALMRSAQPAGKLSLRLRVDAGSLHETDAQRGLAHFLEHMAFNGSAHFPPGTFTTRLQEAGLAFGSHTNAHTSYDETVYKLDLPDTKPDTITLGLTAIADQCGGLLLAPSEVERERGVILAEMRDREDASFRMWRAQSALFLAGTRVPLRHPIGVAETVTAADAALLRDFYATWYRPERMVLAIVGDADPDQLEPLVRHHLGPVAANGPARPEPAAGAPTLGEAFAAVHEPEADGTQVQFGHVRARSRPADTPATRREQFLRDTAERIVARRLQARIEADAESPLLSGSCFSYQWVGLYQAGAAGAARPGKALAALAILIEEWRRMAEHGPTDAELATERTATISDLDRAIVQQASRTNVALANAIVDAAGEGRQVLSPEAARALYGAWITTATAAEVRDLFRAGWGSEGRTAALVSGRDNLGSTGDQLVAEAFRRAWTAPVAAPAAKAATAWAYAHTADWQGEVTAPAADAVCLTAIVNGIAVQAKRTTFQPNQVLVRLRLHARTAPRPATVAGYISSGFTAGGLGRHSAAELSTLFAGTSIAISGVDIEDDGIVISGSCEPKELDLLLQMGRAAITDAGWRADAENRIRTGWLESIAAQETDLDAAVGKRMAALLYADAPWRQYATAEQVRSSGFAEARAWFEPILRSAPLSVSIVGDIDPVAATRLAAGHLGGGGRPLPPVSADAASHRAALPAATPMPVGEHRLAVPGKTARAAILAAWPTDDMYDIQRTRRLGVLAGVFTERLREHIREQLGQAYSPYATHTAASAYRGEGLLAAHISVAPDQADRALAAVRAIAQELASQGISDDVFRRVVTPMLKGVVAQRQKNGYWLGSVLDRAAEQPFRLAWSQTMEADLAAITVVEVSTLAATYLAQGRELVVIGVCAGNGQPLP